MFGRSIDVLVGETCNWVELVLGTTVVGVDEDVGIMTEVEEPFEVAVWVIDDLVPVFVLPVPVVPPP